MPKTQVSAVRNQYHTPPGIYGKQVRRNLFLPDSIVEQLKERANTQRISYSELVRQVLSQYLQSLSTK